MDYADRFIVGVDYGTTYTGFSVIFPGSSGPLWHVVKADWEWPKSTAVASKIPSRIAYGTENKLVESSCWGPRVRPGMLAASWTKLLLGNKANASLFYDEALDRVSQMGILRLPPGKTEMEVVADYLRGIRLDIMKKLDEMFTREWRNTVTIQFCFTVPTSWPPQSRMAVWEAARRAGFEGSSERPHDKISILTETDAALFTILKDWSSENIPLKRGDTIVICDCGGGTVDIASYLVSQLHPVKVENIGTDVGALCGGTTVDRALYELMSRRFGYAFDSLPVEAIAPGSIFMNTFESVKKDISPEDLSRIHRLPLPMRLLAPIDPTIYDAKEMEVLLSWNDICEIFWPAIKAIRGLLCGQVKQLRNTSRCDPSSVTRIALVGGFAESELLYGDIRSMFGIDWHIQVMRPNEPQKAVVVGAALWGYDRFQSHPFMSDILLTSPYQNIEITTHFGIENPFCTHGEGDRMLDWVFY